MYKNWKAVIQTSCISSKGILQIHDPRDLMTSLSLLQQLTYSSDHPSLAAAARKTEKNEVSTSRTTPVVCSACCSAPLLLFFCSCCLLLVLPRKLGLESKDWTSLSLSHHITITPLWQTKRQQPRSNCWMLAWDSKTKRLQLGEAWLA